MLSKYISWIHRDCRLYYVTVCIIFGLSDGAATVLSAYQWYHGTYGPYDKFDLGLFTSFPFPPFFSFFPVFSQS